MRKVTFLIVVLLLAAAATSVYGVTATYLWDDFNGVYLCRPVLNYNTYLEQHFNPSGVFNGQYEKAPEHTGYPTPLVPHNGTDSCQAYRYYQSYLLPSPPYPPNTHPGWNFSSFQNEQYKPFEEDGDDMDLVDYAITHGWLPIDVHQPITYEIMVWGWNQATNPDDPGMIWKQTFSVHEEEGVTPSVCWTSANNQTWVRLTATPGQGNGRYLDKCQFDGQGHCIHGWQLITYEASYPAGYWQSLPLNGVSTQIWENLIITYTPESGSIPGSIGVAKTMADNTPVNLVGKIVTAKNTVGPSNRIYIEEADRSSGIWVIPAGGIELPGNLDVKKIVTVRGVILTDNAVKERYILDGKFTVGDTGTMDPVVLNGRAAGGGDFGQYVEGAEGQFGLNNIGLLVRYFGTVTSVDEIGGLFFYVDDGAGYLDGTTHNEGGGVFVPNVGVRVYDPTGGNILEDAYVRVDGIVAKVLPEGLTNPIMVILPRTAGDVFSGPW